MPLNYDDEIVIWSYHAAKPTDTDPSKEELQEWDQNLFDTYDKVLEPEMEEQGIALTRRNKSRVVLLAEESNGVHPRTRVRNACKYFAAAMLLDLDVSDG